MHKYLLSSNITNINYESTYPIANVKDSIQSLIHNFLPSLIAAVDKREDTEHEVQTSSTDYIKLNIRTYNMRTITKLLFPDMLIAPNSTVDIRVSANHEDDYANMNLPFFGIRNKVRLHHFKLDGKTSDPHTLALQLSGDSVIVYAGKSIVKNKN